MFNINIHDHALAHIVASALESYLVAAPNVGTVKHLPLETSGSLFGRTTALPHDAAVQIDLTSACTHISAYRQRSCVERLSQSDQLHRNVYRRVMPSIDYLGDFHSHPYSHGETLTNGATVNLRTITQRGLYRFSGHPADPNCDFSSVNEHAMATGSYGVSLVITLYRMRSCRSAPPVRYQDGYSAIEFAYAEDDGLGKITQFCCWLKAYVFPAHTKYPINDKSVFLFCPALGLSQSMLC